MEATVRAKRRVVSKPAATIHLPGFLVHDPGCTQNLIARSGIRTLLVLIPTFPSSPASSARWIAR